MRYSSIYQIVLYNKNKKKERRKTAQTEIFPKKITYIQNPAYKTVTCVNNYTWLLHECYRPICRTFSLDFNKYCVNLQTHGTSSVLVVFTKYTFLFFHPRLEKLFFFLFFGEDKEDFILCEMKWDNINLLTYKIAFSIYLSNIFHWFLGKSRVHPLNRGWRYVRACHNSIRIFTLFILYFFQVFGAVNLSLLFILFLF